MYYHEDTDDVFFHNPELVLVFLDQMFLDPVIKTSNENSLLC